MIGSLYQPGHSPIHHLPAGIKLWTLFIVSLTVFWINDGYLLGTILIIVVVLIRVARLSNRAVIQQLKPAVLILVLIFTAHALLTDWYLGLVTVMRFAVVLSLAALLTLTTPVSAMMDTLESGLQPFRRIGIRPAQVSLMLVMTLRFIPLLAEQLMHIQAAQQARGIMRPTVTLLIPLLIRTFKMADELAEAIDARGYDAD